MSKNSEAIGLITTTASATNDASTSDGYVLISGSAAGGTSDLGIFKVDHTSGTTITAAEVEFIGILVDYGITITNGMFAS